MLCNGRPRRRVCHWATAGRLEAPCHNPLGPGQLEKLLPKGWQCDSVCSETASYEILGAWVCIPGRVTLGKSLHLCESIFPSAEHRIWPLFRFVMGMTGSLVSTMDKQIPSSVLLPLRLFFGYWCSDVTAATSLFPTGHQWGVMPARASGLGGSLSSPNLLMAVRKHEGYLGTVGI